MSKIKQKGTSAEIISKSRTNILKLLRDAKVITTSEVAKELSLAWNTAEKRLLELAIEGEVEKIKKTGVNLWVLKK